MLHTCKYHSAIKIKQSAIVA